MSPLLHVNDVVRRLAKGFCKESSIVKLVVSLANIEVIDYKIQSRFKTENGVMEGISYVHRKRIIAAHHNDRDHSCFATI